MTTGQKQLGEAEAQQESAHGKYLVRLLGGDK